MKVLVTGANGFIGSNLCKHLIRDRHSVAGLVRPSGERTFLEGLEPLAIKQGDITEPESLKNTMAEVSIVYNVAGYSSDWGPWATFRRVNVEGVRNVMEAAREAGVKRVVHISSVSVYGFPGKTNVAEDTPFTPRPDDPYITTKAEGERLAMSYNGKGLEVAVIRPAGVYGPNDRTTTLQLAPVLLAGKFAHVDGGRHIMAPVYIDNLVQIIRRAGESAGAPGQAFNAVDDDMVTWREFIEWMCTDLACPTPRLSVPGRLAWPLSVLVENITKAFGKKDSPLINKYRVRVVMRDSHYSTEKAKKLLGYRPRVSTREGMRRTISWYRQYAGLGS
ncbi:MAG: NAD-dependent epimerase/dehydratase family protein [Proteobacteria bacterium]|nr:NAD-dependent epimerase/dehydratase family protein [Pseudomonadota bacterium]